MLPFNLFLSPPNPDYLSNLLQEELRGNLFLSPPIERSIARHSVVVLATNLLLSPPSPDYLSNLLRKEFPINPLLFRHNAICPTTLSAYSRNAAISLPAIGDYTFRNAP